MLLGLATSLAGFLDDYFNRPRAVGFILLFCLFTLTHINRDIESGHIAKGQAELLVYTDNYVKAFNGTCLLSSREQFDGYWDGARVRPAAAQSRLLQVLPVPRRRRDHRRPGRPTR